MTYSYKEINEPSIDQLRECIATGNDSINNRLILDVYGIFKLSNDDYSEFESNIVFKNDIFIANNGYVGLEASKLATLENYFITMLYIFRDYLTSGEINRFSDTHIQGNKEQLLSDIRSLLSRNIEVTHL